MPRLTTRVKRKLGFTNTHLKHRYYKGNVAGRKRMKSFDTEEKAKAWMRAEGLDAKTHELRQHPSGKWQWRKKNARQV